MTDICRAAVCLSEDQAREIAVELGLSTAQAREIGVKLRSAALFYENMIKNDRRFSIRKINHRLHVLDGESVCYSPPDFIQIPNRMALKELADIFNVKDTRSIDDIIDFESKYRRTKNKQARKNP